ncbi:MAG: DUF3276 family protein [Nitrososphaera sp.]|nr:DUF3276 family protein [Nitrososphaera sp.]
MRNNLNREPFITIDDLMRRAEELATDLRELGQRKYPLDIRRGVVVREEVSDVADIDNSKTVKAGAKTYFLDIVSSKANDDKYLRITESRFKGEGNERERSSIIVFPDNAEEFLQAVSEMVAKLS